VPAMNELILSELLKIEAREQVKIVFACESGSRAWGFPSADSDYDIRFIYLHPQDWYLSVYEKRDVIELPLSQGLDINGWDLRKALQLFGKSNPPLMEWLGSPIIYLEKYTVAQKLRDMAPVFYHPTRCLYHYFSMAKHNYREYLQGEEVWVKKYFYVLRPLLAMRWIERGLGIAPTDFNVIVDRLIDDGELRNAIRALILAKQSGAELDRGPRIPAISDFLAAEMEHWEASGIESYNRHITYAPLDDLFRGSLIEVWHYSRHG
jgi:predicted nucleotidyltransferase